MKGCRPTSVVIQPASIASTTPGPESATARRNQGEAGIRRVRHQLQPSQSASSRNAEPSPTITL